MSSPSDRRGFLRGLVSLPLIGGGVTLVGQPTAVAVSVTDDLVCSYADWLRMELRVLSWEMFPADRERRRGFEQFWHSSGGPVEHFHIPEQGSWRALPQPSTRAALVLSTVGCDWTKA